MKGSGGLRLTGGTARGAKLFSVPGLDVRPALARMRISLFEILRSRLEGARVVDLFAGTGSLGLEALSRGAARALFLDVDPRSLEVLRKNLVKLRFVDRAEVRGADAFLEAPRLAPAEIAFVDPPYDFHPGRGAEMRALVERLVLIMELVVVEHRPKEGLGDVAGARVEDERRYGGTVVTMYARA